MVFKVSLHKKASKELHSTNEPIKRRIVNALRELEDDPFSGDVKPLQGAMGLFRKRVGDYRIIFSVDFENQIVVVLKIGSRGDIYRDL